MRYHRRAAQGLVDALVELPVPRRIGIVGLGEIMRVADAQLLRDEFPAADFVDVTAAFEAVRAQKSDEELAGVRQAT